VSAELPVGQRTLMVSCRLFDLETAGKVVGARKAEELCMASQQGSQQGSQRRAAQLGLLSALLVLGTSFALLINQQRTDQNSSDNSLNNSRMVAPGAAQAPDRALTLSASAHQVGDHANP
jgi:hypothetical protein